MLGVLRSIKKVLDVLTQPLSVSLKPILDSFNESLLGGIKDILVPSDDYLTGKINELRSNFAFADSIVSTFETFRDMFKTYTTEPPVLTIPLGDNKSQYGYDYGVEDVEIDFSWYAEYKPKVDTLLTAFIVVGFVWRQYHNLPETLNGLQGTVKIVDGIQKGGKRK